MKPIRTLITPVVIAAVAVAGLSAAAPARASNDDLAKLLLGLGAIAIIAHAADKGKASASTASRRDDRIVTIPHDHRDKRKHRLRHALPEKCLRTYSSRSGNKRLYSGRCLSKVPYRLARLPEACAYTIAGRQGVRGKAYGPRCLARHGFYKVDGWRDDDRRRDVHRRDDRRYDDRHIVWSD